MSSRALVTCFFVSALVAPSLVAAKAPAKIAVIPGGEKAALLIRAELLPIPPTYKTSFRIGIQRYDPQVQSMKGGPYSGSMVTIAATRSSVVDGYMVVEVTPGTYAFRDFSRQDFWALCFNGGSLQFSVGPGEILFLGEMDVRAHVRELQTLAVGSGRTRAGSGRLVHFFDKVTPPILAPIDEASLADAATFVKTHMPASTVAPKAAQYSPARFGTGSDLFGTQRICGGYFQKRAKSDDAPKG